MQVMLGGLLHEIYGKLLGWWMFILLHFRHNRYKLLWQTRRCKAKIAFLGAMMRTWLLTSNTSTCLEMRGSSSTKYYQSLAKNHKTRSWGNYRWTRLRHARIRPVSSSKCPAKSFASRGLRSSLKWSLIWVSNSDKKIRPLTLRLKYSI